MLTAQELDLLGSLLLSDSITLKGTQLIGAFNLIQRLDQEKRALMVASRITPLPPAPPVVDPAST